MAALPEPRPTLRRGPLVDLRELRPDQLEGLLMDEGEAWFQHLHWDFVPSANLVRRFVAMRALNGFALCGANNVLAGYVYYVADEGKGLVGGLHLLPEYRSEENEDLLLRAALDDLWKTPALYRVEAQLMLLHRPLEREVPYASRFRAFPRQFLEIDFESIAALPPREVAIPITAWSDNRRAEGSRLISQAYAGHIDSQINDQYRSPGGARKFLTNIIEYPGCGAFYPLASFVATEGRKTGLAGMSLASVVAQGIGHITQACVMPAQRGTGLGYELLRRSLVSLAAHGCRRVSLTVTSANTEAIELYRRMGFTRTRDFAAYVWELR